MDNPVTEVPLRKRSTPYGFTATIMRQGKALTVYKGASANSAGTAYWQAVSTVAFLQGEANIDLAVTLSGLPYGGFTTEFASGKAISLHVATGECLKWMSGSWSGDHLYEKMLATIPGLTRPFQP
jgi:hypothetical protein